MPKRTKKGKASSD